MIDLSSYEAAKLQRDRIDQIMATASAKLVMIDGAGSGPMGITPDSVKALPEYRAAKSSFDYGFRQLREFNAQFVRKFRAEIRAERAARFK